MITFKLNGKKVQGEDGQTVLQVAEKYGVEIPTLCHHKALDPAGMCRMCTVEMFDGRRTKFVTACNYPIWEGMEIFTDTETVHEGRKLIVEMLLSRCTSVPEIQNLAKKYGIEKSRFGEDNENDCILCGLCVRVCEKMGNSAITLTGRGLEMKVDTPFSVQSDICKGCGACEFICPTGHIKLENINKGEIKKIPSEYELGLKGRKPVYVPYAQAVPNTPAIDRRYCMHFKTGGCQICTEVCGVNAIDHTMQDEIVELEVGSIVLAPGAKVYNPGKHDTYNYNTNPNVVTSLEFERILSASGPYGGHLVRPSDHVEPKKIAWIQCVGSRDEHLDGKGYCSGVCCTYAVKEAMLAKDHCPEGPDGLDAAIFYIDIRTNGKDFERFYNRAKDGGVRFVKSKVTKVDHNDETGMEILRYVDAAGKLQEEEFDIVVLSVGFEVAEETKEMAKKLGLEVDKNGFAVSSSFNPVQTSRDGVFVCGAFSAPKDIPTSVIDSSAAAGVTGGLLADSRFTLTKTAEIPPERAIKGDPTRIGVFLCCCGSNIAGVVDMPKLEAFAKTLPDVAHVEVNMYSCSQDTQEKMSEVIRDQNLNRVVVAACTPKTHEPLFQETLIAASLNKYLFEMANIRNHCSWVHKDAPDKATLKAMETVRMSVQKAALAQPLTEPKLSIVEKGLVIGGGVAGMEAAKNLAAQGYETHILERTDQLGGQARSLHKTWKGEDVQKYLAQLISDIESNELITVHKNAEITNVEGFVGDFKTTFKVGEEETTYNHGVTIFACGATEYKPTEYLYGQDPRVVTNLELEKKLIQGDAGLKSAGAAVFIQCVGSRIPSRPYCSKLCCTQSIKNALALKKANPKKPVFVLYRDMRPYGLRENLYREAREKGVTFIRYNDDKPLDVTGGDKLTVSFTDYVLGKKLQISPELLVLAAAIVPEERNPLAQAFKVSQNQDGFFAEAHVKLRPNDFATDGVFLCGLTHGPKPIDEAIAQAQAAAARAVTLLSRKEISVAGTVASVDSQFCSGCKVCVSICPYSAPLFNEKTGKAEIQSTLCKGCGLCVASCRSGAIHLAGFDTSQIFSMIDAL
ncbi:Heterodisulfide reductase, subunit A-like protein [Desulfatibacillum aliphaticivorans]|uniref:Heterodisulfide reductase, subunit A-like protein n=1 Tax=Desulfatibacillum aliphaticivorans TaxID=218208 RepID=B8FDY0_DESAL|nr:FAD-dependent oxidoreductase [Desulfatibacillum aliphaticivorans]ACL06761.1 Heterodisulfide reductase, subunit A-like protein [Desulfatibacillum aliphaticivorans]